MALPRVLESRRVRRALGVALTVKGLVGLLAPRLTMKLVARLLLREAYENPGDLEPTHTYVRLVRDASLATLVFGTLTLLRAGSADTGSAVDGDGDEREGADSDGPESTEPDPDDGGANGR